MELPSIRQTDVVTIACSTDVQKQAKTLLNAFKNLEIVKSGQVLLPGLVVFAKERLSATKKLVQVHSMVYPVRVVLDITLSTSKSLTIILECPD